MVSDVKNDSTSVHTSLDSTGFSFDKGLAQIGVRQDCCDAYKIKGHGVSHEDKATGFVALYIEDKI